MRRKREIKVIDEVHVVADDGKMKEGALNLLGPAPGLCRECAVDHRPEEPHNRDSLYYQMQFHAKNGRWPTWADAIAHCPDGHRESLIPFFRDRGLWPEE